MDDEQANRIGGMVFGALAPIVVGGILVSIRDHVSTATLALAMVVVVVVAAAIGGPPAGATAAVVSAMSFDFYFTRPYNSLNIASGDDVETTALLLVVGLIVGVVAASGQRSRRSASAGREEIVRIHRVAEAAAKGAEPRAVIALAQDELVAMMHLESCRFEALPAEKPLPRLERDGKIGRQREWRFTRGGFELPPEGVELPVLARGHPVGRFVLVPTPGVGVSLEQRVVAVAVADQVGGALAAPTTTSPPTPVPPKGNHDA